MTANIRVLLPLLLVSRFYPEFTFSISFTVAPTPGNLSNGKVRTRFEPKAVPTVAQRVCSARRGNSQKHGRSSANVAARIAPGSASSVFTPLQAADVPDGSIAIACGLLDGAAQAS